MTGPGRETKLAKLAKALLFILQVSRGSVSMISGKFRLAGKFRAKIA